MNRLRVDPASGHAGVAGLARFGRGPTSGRHAEEYAFHDPVIGLWIPRAVPRDAPQIVHAVDHHFWPRTVHAADHRFWARIVHAVDHRFGLRIVREGFRPDFHERLGDLIVGVDHYHLSPCGL